MWPSASSSRSAKTGSRFRRAVSNVSSVACRSAGGRQPNARGAAVWPPLAGTRRAAARLLDVPAFGARLVGPSGEDVVFRAPPSPSVAAAGADADRLGLLLGRDDL